MDIDPEQAELFGMIAPAFAPLAREYVSHSMQRKRLAEKKEMEIEMIEARAEAKQNKGIVKEEAAAASAASQEPDDPVDAAISAAETLERRIDEFKRESWCEACQEAAEALKHQPVPRARKGLQELREMERMVEAGADVDDVAARMEEFEVITDALAEV